MRKTLLSVVAFAATASLTLVAGQQAPSGSYTAAQAAVLQQAIDVEKSTGNPAGAAL